MPPIYLYSEGWTSQELDRPLEFVGWGSFVFEEGAKVLFREPSTMDAKTQKPPWQGYARTESRTVDVSVVKAMRGPRTPVSATKNKRRREERDADMPPPRPTSQNKQGSPQSPTARQVARASATPSPSGAHTPSAALGGL